MLINCVLSGPSFITWLSMFVSGTCTLGLLGSCSCLSVCFNLWLYKPRFDKRESKLKYLCVFVCLFSIFLSFMGKKCFRYMEYMIKVDLLWISTSVWSSVTHILGHQHTFLGVPFSALWQLMEGGGEEKGTNWWSGASKQRVIACIFLFLLTQKLEEVNYPSDSNGIYNLLSKFNYSLNWVTAVVFWLLPLLWRVLCTAFVMDGRQAVLDVSPSEWRLANYWTFSFQQCCVPLVDPHALSPLPPAQDHAGAAMSAFFMVTKLRPEGLSSSPSDWSPHGGASEP